jgi:chitinase
MNFARHLLKKTGNSFLLIVLSLLSGSLKAQELIGYYSGNARQIPEYSIEKLSEVIFSFCHLSGNRLTIGGRNDSLTIRTLVSLKEKNPSLKIVLSLGAWGGCKTCSDVFSSETGRNEFCYSVKKSLDYFNADGIDIDWEFPSLAAFPGFPFSEWDKDNLTKLVRLLRKTLGPKKQISILCAGFSPYLEGSFSYAALLPYVDRFNLMTYDLIGSHVHRSGHQSALYSTSWQISSADHAIHYLDSLGIPHEKIALGVAFYARLYKLRDSSEHGLNQPADFKKFVSMKLLRTNYSDQQGYLSFWDSVANAPYKYNAKNGEYLTYDDERSVAEKSAYARNKRLNGIFFWEIRLDEPNNGLMNALLKDVGKENPVHP